MPTRLTSTLQGWGADLIASVWVHDLALLLLSALLTWFVARRLERHLDVADASRRSGEEVILRRLVQVSIWPLLALGLCALALHLSWPAGLTAGGDSRRILAILGFFLAYRWIDLLISQFAVSSARRRQVRKGLLPAFFALLVLQQLSLLGVVLDGLRWPIFQYGQIKLTALSIIAAILAILGASFAGRLVSILVGRRFLPHVGIETSLADAIGTIVRYILVVIGVLWGLEVLGFDLTTLKIGMGALGLGIGFGLQSIVNNFTSGLILLFEGSVKRGDILTVEGTDGRVERVGLRASVLRTRKGDDLIMPNSVLAQNLVVNYSYRDNLQRVDVDVGVSYDADPEQIRDLLLAVARNCELILPHPPPVVLFMNFGASSIDFQLRTWIDDAWKHPLVRSELLFGIWYALKKAGIEIPFPQRDLHLRGGDWSGLNATHEEFPP